MASDKIPLQIVNAITGILDSWEENYFEELRETFDESGYRILFTDYTRKVNIISAFVFSVTLIISIAVNEMIFNIPFNRNMISSLAISMSFGTLSLIVGHIKPAYQRSQNKNFLENNLIYSLSYMSCLASSGMPIERIFRRVGEVEDNPPFKALINRFLVNVNLLGLDILSALNEMADQSPSKNLTKIVSSIRTTIMTSGDLKNLLLYEVDRQLQKKREVLKNSVNMLVYVGEIYVTMMVVTPVLFILMITILSIMGGIGGGAVVQLNLIIFFGIPVMTAAFIIILDQVLVIEE
jgi:archaeal flagellar protein FlaJ